MSIADMPKEESWNYWDTVLEKSWNQISDFGQNYATPNLEIVYDFEDERVYELNGSKDNLVFKIRLNEGELLEESTKIRTFELEYERGSSEYFEELTEALDDNFETEHLKNYFGRNKGCDFIFPKNSEEIF